MKTEQEHLFEMINMLEKLEKGDYCCDNCYGCCGDGKIEITCPNVVFNFIQALHEAGYGDVSGYKAEREMLGSQIKTLEQRLNDKCVEVYNLNRDYCNALERLKAQEREIEQLKTEVKQAQIDVLNELKPLLEGYIHTTTGESLYVYTCKMFNIEVENAEDKS